MDAKTIRKLIAEAKKNEAKHKVKWLKDDAYDDMKDMEFWGDAAGWLEQKLSNNT